MLKTIDARLFEAGGIAASAVGCCAIIAQCLSEWQREGPSSMSPIYLLSWLFVFVFWTAYGLRFGRSAIIIGNGVAIVLQIALIVICLG